MRKLLTFLIALGAIVFAVVSPVRAGSMMLLGTGRTGGGATYTGPGDVVASAKAWYGLRAYSAATRGTNVADICTTIASVDTCATMVSDATTGNLVLTTIGGTTCNNTTQICNVKTLYDQSGANQCSAAACNIVQATVANRPIIVTSCLGSLPCAGYNGSAASKLLSAASITAITQSFTSSVVANKNAGSGGDVFASGTTVYQGFGASANQAELNAGTTATITAADSTWHALQYLASGASSSITLDGTTTGSLSAGTNSFTGTVIVGSDSFGNNYAGRWTEMGIWSGSFTGGQITSMNSNQHSYWGF